VALSQEIAQVLRLPLDGAAAPAHTPPNAPPVLDAEQGLARWAGEDAVYQQALQQFVDEHAHSASTYTRLHANGDLAGLRALAHRVCGVAANLGFVQLTALLKALEQAAVSGESLTLFQTLQTLPEALAACRHAVPQRQIVHAAPVPVDTPHQPWPEVRAQVLALTDALAQNIRRGAVDDAMLNDLASALDGHLPPKLVDRIRRALDDFDFEQANLHLTALLARIDEQPDSPPQP
jgi:two-component system sensor histidine kinase/response regulator